MWRKGPDAVSILNPAIAGVTAFSADEFDFHSQSGVDGSLFYDNGCGKGFELRYFWIDEFSDDKGPLPLGRYTFGTNPVSPLRSNPFLRYESSLQSFELLRRSCRGRFNFSYGFRYANLTDSLRFFEASNPSLGAALFRAQNDLYGFQLGADGPIWDRGGRFRINGFMKTGIYWNDVNATSEVTNTGTTSQSIANSDTAAFLYESGISASYAITCNLSLTAGYRFLFMDGVALGADQVPNTTGPVTATGFGPVSVDKNSLYYHGFNVGLEWRR